MTNLDGIFKSRHITLPTKISIVKAMFFPVLICGHESCPPKRLSITILMFLNSGAREDS